MKACIALTIAAVVAGCSSSGPQASGTFQTHASADRLFSAAVASVSSIGYHTTSADRASGLITAEQGVILGHSNSVGMTAEVIKQGNVRILRVNFVAPPGTFSMGDFGMNVGAYINVVRAHVPDLQAAN